MASANPGVVAATVPSALLEGEGDALVDVAAFRLAVGVRMADGHSSIRNFCVTVTFVLPILGSRMRHYEATSVIAADAEAVWAVLGPSFDQFARGLKLRVESGG
jgi:hypothetical protein